MENLKVEPLDEREEGEISLEDVSSSEDMGCNFNRRPKKYGVGKRHIKREIDILSQDADHGKENRRFSNELIGSGMKPIATTLQEKNDDLMPISSDEDMEYVGLPGTSKQLAVPVGPKKKRKKKKKKKSGQRMLVIDDLVSTYDEEPDIIGVVNNDRRDYIVPRPYEDSNDRSPSPIRHMDSPPRHNGWHIPSVPMKSHHLSLKHNRSPSPRQKSPRQYVSPKKSPSLNHDRRSLHKSSRDLSPGRYKDTYASSLLKKVRHLDTVGSITPVNQQKLKESSLKDKLSNMMIKSLPETNETINDRQSEIDDDRKPVIKADDEEDLEFLRRRALETKQLKNNLNPSDNDETITTQSNAVGNVNNSDDDEEDLELRMIALRSAVMKKHNDRIKRGVMRKKNKTHIKDESPFSDSFLDSLDEYLDNDSSNDEVKNDSDVPDRTLLTTQLPIAENAHVEDMDLDSDVEREKENSRPYSPTDNISPRPFIDPEIPDASVANPPIDPFFMPDDNPITNATSQYSNNYTPNFNDYTANIPSTYSSMEPMCQTRVEGLPREETNITSRDPRLRRYINPNIETPPSSNDTTMLNSTLPVFPPEIPIAGTQSNGNMISRSLNSSNLIVVPLANNYNNSLNIPVPLQQNPSLPLDSNPISQWHDIQRANTKEARTVNSKVQDDVTYNDIIRDLAEYTGEPLYLQNVPDVTKDANKIPTLVNRILVPAPILKTNKQLQQPLPSKKVDVNNEPTFKNAEMLPVNIQPQSTISNSTFKPIKLQSFMKKSQVITPPAVAFNDTTNYDASSHMNVSSNVHSEKTMKNQEVVNSIESSRIGINSYAKDTVETTIASTIENKTKVRRPRTPRNKAEITKKHQEKTGGSGKSTILANEQMNTKITIRKKLQTTENNDSLRKNKKSTGEVEKSDVNNSKNDNIMKKPELKKINRSKSATRTDENSKNNSKLKKNTDEPTKQSKEGAKKVLKSKLPKNSELNIKNTNVISENKALGTKVDNKKRRSSIDEDEESLRAALLASLPKRMKISNQKSTATTKSLSDSTQSVKKKSNDVNKELSKEKQQPEAKNMLPPATVPTRSVRQKNTTQNKTTANVTPDVIAKKRSNTTDIENSLNKIVKQSTASTTDKAKLINAAGKIVDAEIQRKLALQKVAIDLLANKSQQPNSKTNLPRSTNAKDVTPSTCSKISASKNMERMIIHLGEDSNSESDDDDDDDDDDDNDYDGGNGDNDDENVTKQIKTKNVKAGNTKVTNKAPTIPKTDFEKSIVEFLRTQREKLESATTPTIATAKSSTSVPVKKSNSIISTPLAVRHLPASKQEEYRRLKQRIAEREQQNMNRNIQISTKNSVQTASVNEGTPSSLTSTSTPDINDTTSAKIPQTSLDASYKPVTAQTRLGESALELLTSEIKKDISENNDCITSSSLLLPDIPIKTEASVLEATSIVADDNSKVRSTIVSNLNKDESELNLMNPIGSMTNLTIQFPNTKDDSVPFVRHISIARSDNVPKEQTTTPKSPPRGLRILTTDQLNMKYEYTPTGVNEDGTQIEDSKPTLNEIIQINNGKNNATPAHNTVENIDNNLIDSSITVETCKIETNCDNTEWSMSNYQTTVDSETSTIISSQHDSSTIITNNDKLNTTAELDSTILLHSTVVESNINPISDPTLNTQTTLSYEDLNTETKVLAQKSSDKIELDVQKQLEAIYTLPDNEQRIQLTTMEKDLVAKRYVVVHDLAQIAEDLREWEIQTDLVSEVTRLRLQLQEAEKRLQAQCVKTTNMKPRVTQMSNKIDEGRNECTQLSRLCQGIGSKVMGPTYKIPSTGNQLLKEQLRKVASMSKHYSKIKEPSIVLNNEQSNVAITVESISDKSHNDNSTLNSQSVRIDVEANSNLTPIKIENDSELELVTGNAPDNVNTQTLMDVSIQKNVHMAHEMIESVKDTTLPDSNSLPFDNQFISHSNNVDRLASFNNDWLKIEDEKPTIQPAVSYESVLTSLNTPKHIDPNGVLCPYELMGTCSDDACPYNHLDANRS
ncbi:hypothetical protein PV327_004379 [Microctonus hyperodae]|uniref:C3H1-type domain-containing protein n=1 Tax=Microctonus hyperodae TaxID=165561 RepID=A0AA39FCF0_MICHY|nr:hypothetical protein PV327_004379 [Microctonus hyperodae]